MIKRYLIERRSWILLFVFVHALFIFIAYIDPSIPFSSILYIVFLSLLIFVVFLIIRYHQETTFYKSVKNWDDVYDASTVESAQRPFEKIVQDSILRQTEQTRKTIDTYKIDLDQEKDELLSWIHEVKTPLTTMQLMLDRVNDDVLKTQLMVEWVRIDLLLDQQLHQKRIPFIENDVFIERVSIKPLIYSEIKALQSWCMQKGIGFDVSLSVTDVLSDEKWLSFIIRQLLTNAIKYSEPSDIKVRSYITNEQTRLDVVDAGRGIDPKDLPRIFDKGFTSTGGHRDTAATGMGLYLVKKVADTLLITVEVQSVQQGGTTFTLIFPKKNEFVHISSM